MNKPLPRWLDSGGPPEAALRTALLDARRGPSEAQMEALAKRIAELRAAPPPRPSHPRIVARRSHVARWLAGVGVGLSLLMSAWMWNWRDSSERVSSALPRPPASAVSKGERPVLPTPESDGVRPPERAAATSQQTAARAQNEAKKKSRKGLAAQTRASTHDALNESFEEVELLQKARRALLSRPLVALALVLKHREVFPHGIFSEERRAIQIEALWRLERVSEAQRQWNAFVQDYPHSTYRERLQRLSPSGERAHESSER